MFLKITRGTLLILFIFFWIFHLLVLYKTSMNLTKSWFWNFSAYFTPVYIITEILILLYLILKRRYKWLIAPVLLLFFSAENFNDTFQLNPEVPTTDSSSFKVLSFNTTLIPQGAGSGDSAYLDTNLRDEFYDIIKKSNPDILCLQEFHHKDVDNLDVINQLSAKYNYQYYFMSPVFLARMYGYSGPIIFSRYPLINNHYIKFKAGENDVNRLVAVDALIHGDTIRVINIHLKSMSIRVSRSEENLFKSFIDNTQSIYSKLETGFKDQKKQLEEAYQFIEKSPYPVILCGDFNSLPYSYNYQFLKERMKNTYNDKGNGFGYTLNRFPYFARIDNIFVSKKIEVLSHKILSDYKRSDHFPLIVELDLPQ